MPSKQSMNHGLEVGPVGLGLRSVKQTVLFGDFTDGAGAAGTLNLTKKIPAGSFVIGSKVKVVTGFTGDTTCTLAIGDTADPNAFTGNGTVNILAAADNLVSAAFIATDCGLNAESTANTVLLTATGASDWGLVAAGEAIVEVFYFSTNEELA